MKLNRLDTAIMGMVALVLIVQCVILYKQSNGSVRRGFPPPPAVVDVTNGTVLDLTGMPITGTNDKSKIVLVEFSDYECPFCIRHATGVAQDIDTAFVGNGRIQHAFANNPLPIHMQARFLAESAICAGQQGRYWEMHDIIFREQPRNSEGIHEIASRLKLEKAQFRKCLQEGGEKDKQIDFDIKAAQYLKLSGTPAFAVGLLNDHKRLVVKKLIVGAQPMSVFEKVINEVSKSEISSLN